MICEGCKKSVDQWAALKRGETVQCIAYTCSLRRESGVHCNPEAIMEYCFSHWPKSMLQAYGKVWSE